MLSPSEDDLFDISRILTLTSQELTVRITVKDNNGANLCELGFLPSAIQMLRN